MCAKELNSLSFKETYADHILRAEQAGHVHVCNKRIYSKLKVSANGKIYEPTDYYAIPYNDRDLKAKDCTCGKFRVNVVVSTVPTAYCIGVSAVPTAYCIGRILYN